MTQYNPLLELYQQNYVIPYSENFDYYVIGDVHGCFMEYFTLYTILNDSSKARNKVPVIIQLGDIIDRGPSFENVILDDPADFKVMGNHESNFINESLGNTTCKSKSRKDSHDRFNELNEGMKRSVMQALTSRKQFYVLETPEHKYVFTHAPIRNVDENFDVNDVVKLLSKYSLGGFCMRSTEVNNDKIQSIDTKGKRLTFFHGHQSWSYKDINEQIHSQIDRNVKIFNLDSGCVYGDTLTAMRVGDNAVFQVTASRQYVDKH